MNILRKLTYIMNRAIPIASFLILLLPLYAQGQMNGPGGLGGGGGNGASEIDVQLTFLGPNGIWHGRDKICEFNSNHDFTEFDGEFESNKKLWCDNGIAPMHANPDPIILGGLWYIDSNEPKDKNFLEIVSTDDRLVSMKLHVDAPAHITHVKYYFDVLNFSMVIFKDNGAPRAQKGSLAPVTQDGAHVIQTNKDYYFLVESVVIHRSGVLRPFGEGQGGGPQMEEVSGQLIAKCQPTNDPMANWETEYINTDAGTVDLVLCPANYEEGIENPLPVQQYVNEYVESHPELGAWIRVNDDFSKKNRVVGTGEMSGYRQDNEPGFEDVFDYEKPPNEEGEQVDKTPNHVLMEAKLKAFNIRPGKLTIKLPDNVVLWEVKGDDEPVAYQTEHSWNISEHNNLMDRKFYVEAIEKSPARAVQQIKLKYEPVGKAIVGMNRNADLPFLHDEARYTAAYFAVHFDGDRNGEFDETSILDKHLLFWSNADIEIKDDYGGKPVERDRGDRSETTPAELDWQDLKIHQQRDIEDCAQVFLYTDLLLVDLHCLCEDDMSHAVTDILDADAIMDSTVETTIPNFHMYDWQQDDLETKDHIETDFYKSVLETQSPQERFEGRVTPLPVKWNEKEENPHVDLDKHGFKTRVFDVREKKRFVMEAIPKQGLHTKLNPVATVIHKTETEYLLSNKEEVKIKPIEEFYDKWTIGGDEAKQMALKKTLDVVFPKATLESEATVYAEFDALEPDFFELPSKQSLVFVHGWNNNAMDKKLAIQTFTKRMYWQGFQGRIVQFSWPCLISDSDGPTDTEMMNLTFNPSEFNAFRSGFPLLHLLAHLRATSPKGVHTFAHSQGNVPIAEAMRLWFYGPNEDVGHNASGLVWAADMMGRGWDDKSRTVWSQNERIVDTYIAANSAFSRGAYGSDGLEILKHDDVRALRKMEDYTADEIIDSLPYWLDYVISTPWGLGAAAQRNHIKLFLEAMLQRWQHISKCSDFYRFFGAGAPEIGNPKVLSWEDVEPFVFDGEPNYQKLWSLAVGFRGDKYLMLKTESAVARRVNYFSELDYATSLPWNANAAIKGFAAVHGSWNYTYASMLDRQTGEWTFVRHAKPGWMTDERSILLTLFFDKKVSKVTSIIKALVDEYDIATKVAQMRQVLAELGGTEIKLGDSNSEVANLDAGAYEVLAFLARPSARAMGIGPMELPGWFDIEQSENASNVNGNGSTPTHSFFYYHNSNMNKKMFKTVVTQVKAALGQSGIGSSYPDNGEGDPVINSGG